MRGQIEQLTGQLKDLTDRAAFATLTATFGVPVVAVEAAPKGWDPAAVVDEASASLIDILQALATAGIWFAHRLAADPRCVLGLIVGDRRRGSCAGSASSAGVRHGRRADRPAAA